MTTESTGARAVAAGEAPGTAAKSGRAGGPQLLELSSSDCGRVLDLARIAISVAAGATPASALDAGLAAAADLDASAAAFVTLTEGGQLRGCMGTLAEDRPLAWSVARSALLAAQRDPRFEPISPAELTEIHVEVSILGPASELREAAAFRPGVDGIIVQKGSCQALMLPEVATDQGWGTAEMLSATCRKAGLPTDAWRKPGTRLSVFRTLRFGGPAVVRREG